MNGFDFDYCWYCGAAKTPDMKRCHVCRAKVSQKPYPERTQPGAGIGTPRKVGMFGALGFDFRWHLRSGGEGEFLWTLWRRFNLWPLLLLLGFLALVLAEPIWAKILGGLMLAIPVTALVFFILRLRDFAGMMSEGKHPIYDDAEYHAEETREEQAFEPPELPLDSQPSSAIRGSTSMAEQSERLDHEDGMIDGLSPEEYNFRQARKAFFGAFLTPVVWLVMFFVIAAVAAVVGRAGPGSLFVSIMWGVFALFYTGLFTYTSVMQEWLIRRSEDRRGLWYARGAVIVWAFFTIASALLAVAILTA